MNLRAWKFNFCFFCFMDLSAKNSEHKFCDIFVLRIIHSFFVSKFCYTFQNGSAIEYQQHRVTESLETVKHLAELLQEF